MKRIIFAATIVLAHQGILEAHGLTSNQCAFIAKTYKEAQDLRLFADNLTANPTSEEKYTIQQHAHHLVDALFTIRKDTAFSNQKESPLSTTLYDAIVDIKNGIYDYRFRYWLFGGYSETAKVLKELEKTLKALWQNSCGQNSSCDPVITIVTLSTPNRYMFADIAEKNQRAYAKQHGYHYVKYTHSLDPSRPEEWSKILTILEQMEKKPCWVLWIDDDIIITDPQKPLHYFIEKYGTNKNLIIAHDALYQQGVPINNGIFLIRTCAWSELFFKEVWQVGQQRNYLTRGQSLLEQQTMTDLIEENRMYHRKTIIIPQREINSFIRSPLIYMHDPIESIWQPGDFAAHVTGMPFDDRIRIMEYLANQSTPQPIPPEILFGPRYTEWVTAWQEEHMHNTKSEQFLDLINTVERYLHNISHTSILENALFSYNLLCTLTQRPTITTPLEINTTWLSQLKKEHTENPATPESKPEEKPAPPQEKPEPQKDPEKKPTQPQEKPAPKKAPEKKPARPQAKPTAKKAPEKKPAQPQAKPAPKKAPEKKPAQPQAKPTAKKAPEKKPAQPQAKPAPKKAPEKKMATPQKKSTPKE